METEAGQRDNDPLRYYARKLQRHPAYRGLQVAMRSVRQLVPQIVRLATSGYRKLPAAVIVGAQKAGTTQLYSYLLEHPRCFGGVAKELHYFSRYADRPLRWYRAQFPLARAVDRVAGLCIEASPSYLPIAQAQWRLRSALPEAKLIVLVRDPVARAFSHYQHEKTRRRETRSFAEAVRDALAQHPPVPNRNWAARPDAPPLWDYVARGYYGLQLEELFRHFPRQQVLLLDSADLFDDTNATCQVVFEFLGLERCEVQPTKVYNRGHYRETVDAATAAVLREHYAPHDRLLAAVTGQEFRWMHQPAGRSAA